MIYPKYGSTFKKIRIHNGFTLSKFSSVGLAPSTLSDFERGQTMISLDKIDLALQLMGSSLGEFDAFLNHYSTVDPLYIIQEVEKAIISQDKAKLEILLRKSEEIDQDIVALSIKILLNKSTKENEEELIDFLFDAKIISHRELFVLYILLFHIKPKEIIYILRKLENITEELLLSVQYNRSITHVLNDSALILAFYGYRDESQKIIENISQSSCSQSLFQKAMLRATLGYWRYQFENKKQGQQDICNFLNFLNSSGNREMKDFYIKKYKRFLEIEL